MNTVSFIISVLSDGSENCFSFVADSAADTYKFRLECVDNIDNTITFTESINDAEAKLKIIVDDIISGNINSKTVQNKKKIKEYLGL